MPTMRGRNQLLHASGTMPRRANTKPNRAVAAAMRMSIGSVIVTPTPTAGPLIAAMIGFFELEDAQRHAAAAVAMLVERAARAAVVERAAAAAEVGAGAERAPGAGDDDRAHRVVGIGAVEGVDQLAAIRSVNAFSFSGRFSVMVRTPSATS